MTSKTKKEHDVEIKTGLVSLVNNELNYCIDKHGNFNSRHEAYGVIKEELEEFKNAFTWVEWGIEKAYLRSIIENVSKKEIEQTLNNLEEKSISAIAEMIQVCSMIKKAKKIL